MEITGEPIGAWLLFNRKPIISCDRTTPKTVISFSTFLITYGKQIPNPCFVYGRNSEKNRRKQLFSMQFSVNPSGENKRIRGFETLIKKKKKKKKCLERVQWTSHT